jgi:hypothetical protein
MAALSILQSMPFPKAWHPPPPSIYIIPYSFIGGKNILISRGKNVISTATEGYIELKLVTK